LSGRLSNNAIRSKQRRLTLVCLRWRATLLYPVADLKGV
jgi:hypothetical protein